MQMRWIGPACALLLGAAACRKEDAVDSGPPSLPAAAAPVTPEAAPATPEVASPVTPSEPGPAPATGTMSPAQQARQLGFARHLPQDVEFMISLRRSAEDPLGWNGFGLLGAAGDAPALPKPEEAQEDPFADEPVDNELVPTLSLVSMHAEELTIALGRGSAQQAGHLAQFARRSGYFHMSAMIHTLARIHLAKSSQDDEEQSMVSQDQLEFREFFRNLAEDGESGVGLFEQTELPPLYYAIKCDAAKREACVQTIASNLGEMAGDLEDLGWAPVEVSRAGSTFTGVKLDGVKFAGLLHHERDSLLELMTESSLDGLIAAVKRKSLVILCGIHGEHVVLFFGSTADDLVLVDQVERSLAGSDALDFAKPYLDKPLLGMLYGQAQAFNGLIGHLKGGLLTSLAAGLRDGVATSDCWGDTRNLEGVLRMLEAREAAMEPLMATEGGLVVVAFADHGIRVEGRGGVDPGWIDWQKPCRLRGLDRNGETALFLNAAIRPGAAVKAHAYLEAIMESGRAFALKLNELPSRPDGSIGLVADGMHRYETHFAGDLTKLWSGLGIALDGGLGDEHALVVDLQGSLPNMADLPVDVASKLRLPRVAWVAPLRDRVKLAAAWREMNPGVGGYASAFGRWLNAPVALPEPTRRDGDGLQSWFYQLPCVNDGFRPSFSMSEGWFVAASSDQQARELLVRAKADGDPDCGLRMRVDFKAIEACGRQALALVEKPEQVVWSPLGDVDPAQLKVFVEACAGLDQLNLHLRHESGVLRSSLHLSRR